jgi:uncharacterized protein (DUF4415 family)
MASDEMTYDPDNPEVTEELFRTGHRGRPAARAALAQKQLVSLRLSPEILEFYRRGGAGWQTRINDTLLGIVKNAGRQDS